MGDFVKAEPGQNFRRKYPRRALKRKMGVLCNGHYFVAESGELGEGGMSVVSEFVLQVGNKVVVSFNIPGGGFVSLRGEIKSVEKANSSGLVTHGVSFQEISFSHKRQIRTFVSSRETKLH